MEVKLEVLLSTSIRQKKPWPRISWLGQEKEAIFLLDDRHVNEINLPSGKTKKKIPRLQLLLKNVVILTTSSNDAWLAGILNTGEIFLWNKDHDCLKTVSATEESKTLITAALESSLRLYIYISGDGKRILLAIPSGFILLWECLESKNILYSKNSSLLGQWSQIKPEESVILPSSEDKEAVVDAIFIRNELLGDCCLCSFTFYSGEYLMLTLLALQWPENISQSISLLSYQVHWAHQECFLCTLVPKCESIKSRGALIIAFSRDGLTLAVTLNQKDPKATQILFINILNFVTLCGSLKGCSNKNPVVPSKLIRSYWVGDISWTHDSLFLACVLKRGSLVLLTCLGELLTLVTFGCSIEFGPAEFIPLHPLITYRPQQFVPQDSSCSLDSTASDNDLMRQRFSVKTHSRLPYLIVSDGYMVTVLRFFDNLSPSVLMKSYLLESSQRLEKIHQGLTCQSKRKNLRLRSLESLRASLLKHQGNQSSVASATPRFLQAEEEVGELTEKMADLQDYEVEESNNSKQFINNFLPFWSQKSDSLFNEIEEGRLEFASMFDTIHAKDDTKENDAIITELHSIQKNLLAAWNIGISKNVENKQLMLNYIVICITHFLYVLQFVKLPSPKQNLPLNKTLRHNLWLQCVFRLFHQCLSVQYWDLRYRQDVGHLVKLTSQTLKLMFIQQQHDQLFSDTLLGCFNLLKMVSDSLNSIYSLQHQVISTADGNKIVNHESLVVPIFQKFSHNCTQKSWPWNSFLKIPPPSINLVQKPSHRLSILWQLLYKQTLWYQAHLSRMDPKDDRQLTEKIALEESIARSLLCHIQANLQTAGYCLNQALELKPVIGEEYFLLGSYEESIQLWKKALQEIRTTGGKRTCLLQTRYYLAQLYCHLYCYNLNDAQGMCDQLVREILRQSQMPIKEEEYFPESFHCAFGIIGNVHPEAAVVVVKCMARFMAAYFTNQKLYVLPPHNVDVLPPLHIESEQSVRIIPLQHSKVASVIRDQNLSYVWTVEYALELLFITGLVPEAVWLSHRLGDWKMAVSIGLAFKLCYKSNSILSRCKKKDLILPLNMTPTRTFQEKLQYFLGQPASLEVAHELGPKYKQFTDPIEEEDVHLLFSSIQEVLKAAVMADADILSETFQLLIDSAKDFSKRLWGLVPVGLYLPSPPLYCPQPAVLSEDHGDDLLLKAEKDYRQKVSGILQRILLLFRAACCSFPAAQWYILKLRWARKVMQKIRIKGFLPSLSPFPESLLHYCKVGMAFYQPGASQDQKLDEVSCKTIGCFRELCALCWMLHVREKLSYSCRQYQIARENMEKKKDMELEFDSCMVEHCLSALEWACRMLPFSRFMNIEELVQDIILSLIGELPPTRKVAEILVKAFPNSEDIRVPLRDKYNSLQQRLRHCTVKGPQTEEMMSVIMHSIHKVRVKALKRVRRNIGPTEMNIWEPPEEETTDKVHTYNGFSLETSLSRSTFTEGEDSVAHSESGTVDTFSKALPSEKKIKNTQHHAESTLINTHDSKKEKINSEDYPESKGDHENLPRENPVPIVGVWEFERDDDEYIKFLDLFLSYVLERDLIGSNNSSIPFLSSFSAHLKEHELNSLLFDVHTTLKRRQGKPKSQNIFRAGSCYVIIPESCESEKSSTLNSENIRDLENQTSTPSVLVVQGPRSFIQNSSIKVIQNMEKRGLFGLKEKSVYRTRDDNREMPTLHRLSKQVFLPQNFKTPKFAYKAVQWDDIIPHEELPLELKNKFGTIAKLLEWMIRWSDRRLLCDSTKPEPSCQYSPVIRVRTSAAAILTSLWLLEQSYARQQTSHVTCKVPENHYFVPSVSLPETKPNIEKESSVDTSCPASVLVLNEIQEVHNSDGPYDNILDRITTHSKEPEIKELIEESISVTHCTDKEFTDFDDDILEEMEAFMQEEIKAQDCRENSGESFGSLKNTAISVSLMPLEGQVEQHSRKKVESSLKESVEELVKISLEQKGMVETVADTKLVIPQSFCLDSSADTPSIQVSAPNDQSSLLPTLVSDPTSVSSNTPISKRHRRHKNESREQMPNSSEPVRQMLQDELFRLVQLQQINFLSLMQIVGSSFSSLPNIQLTQQHLEGSQISGATGGSGDVEHSVKNLNKDLQLRSNGENSRQFEKRRPHHEGIVHSDQNKVRHIQNIPSFCAPSGHLDVSSKNEGVIPQGLGSSTPCSPTVAASNPFHLLSTTPTVDKSPMLIPAVKTLNPANGFPLLKIQMKPEFKPLPVHPVRTPQVPFRPPPEPKEAWGLSSSGKKYLSLAQDITSTSHLNLNQYDVETVQKALEQKRWAEIISRETPKHLNLDQYIDQEKMTPQQDSAAKRQEKAFDVKPEPSEMHNQDFLGVPLLHLQFNPTMFSTASRTSFATPSIPSRPKEKEKDLKEILYPSIKLLHTCLPPEHKCQKPKFIPIENLLAFKQSQQKQSFNLFEHGKLRNIHLLKAKIEPKMDNKKRERRRAKKELEEKSSEKQEKKCVTFQSEDSIINHNDFKVVMKQEDQQEQPIPQATDSFVIPLESLGKDISTSAALHFMASVKKKVVENQDASTNTDPVQEYSNIPQMLAPDVYLNLKFPCETSNISVPPDPTSNVVGHNYINVIDIEASDLLQELPDREETTDDIVNKKESDNLEIPSSANLHYMAASVTNAIPPDHFLSKDLPKLQVQVQESTVKSDGVEDYLTWKQCQDFSTTPCTVPSKKGLDIEHLNSKLLEIDEKLLVLQDIAATVEEDFSNTKLVDPPCALVETEDILELSSPPEVHKVTAFSQTCRSPEEVYSFNHQIDEEVDEEEVEEEEEEEKEEEEEEEEKGEDAPVIEFTETKHTLWKSCSFSSVISSFNVSSDKFTSTGADSSEDSVGSVLADLQISGLTDVADIINDLITESGISSEELGLTEYQAKKLSRIHSTPKRKKSQRTEKEKREIRAWMKKKRKERMAEYLAQLAVKREQEHEPFQSPRKQLCMTSKEIRMCQKMKTEKDRLQLSEHYHRRVAQAYNLMNELLVESAQTTGISPTKPPCGPAKSFRISTRQRHLPPRGVDHNIHTSSPGRNTKVRFAPKPTYIHARSPPRQHQHSFPRNRMATVSIKKTNQVNKRMAQNASSSSDLSREDFGYPCPRARSIKDSKTSSTTTNTEEYGRQHSLANSWALPEEIDKILSRSPNSSLEDISPPEDEGFPISINGLDSGSESTGSILSKIDWRAVDDMVASVENR
ncbi:ciliogenesis and planar polarity effector 1 isoform X1 [Monodelphis domestica]|uniref:ciliogenesis and planar polarity effector 1 isoform X1 n=1 Tax=Monodelphis domestica TaxID=13616 RepID=UPI0024E1D566|nr:ciliogenesis and planar polarity effector 1 isoform X1 [Monodelphis domestica]XP_056680531.1 ciliogenesis and planar polarity effector 1 isoform X1 [Monodelphis domestica]